MKIYITAKPKSKKEYIKKIDSTHFVVAVKEPPVSGYANRAIIESLADFFKKPRSQIYIVSGETSKQKVIEVSLSVEELENLDIQKKLF